MTRRYELKIVATDLNSNIEFGSWRGIEQYLRAKHVALGNREREAEPEGQFKERFRSTLPTSFNVALQRRLRRSLEAASPRLERFGPFGLDLLEELRRSLLEARQSESWDSESATELASIIRAVFGEGNVAEPDAVSDLRAAIASTAAMSLQVSELRLGSIESALLLCGYEELQRHLKLDTLGFDALIQACLVSAVYELYSLQEGAVSVTVRSFDGEQTQASVVAAVAAQQNASPGPLSRVTLDDYLAGWAKRMFAAAMFPIGLAIVVGAAIVFQFDKVDASRQKLAEQQLLFLKQETDTKKATSEVELKNQSELTNQWKFLFEAVKKQMK